MNTLVILHGTFGHSNMGFTPSQFEGAEPLTRGFVLTVTVCSHISWSCLKGEVRETGENDWMAVEYKDARTLA